MTDTMERATSVLDLLEAEQILAISNCMHEECLNQVHWRAACPECGRNWTMCDEHHAIWQIAVSTAGGYHTDVIVVGVPCCGADIHASSVRWVRI